MAVGCVQVAPGRSKVVMIWARRVEVIPATRNVAIIPTLFNDKKRVIALQLLLPQFLVNCEPDSPVLKTPREVTIRCDRGKKLSLHLLTVPVTIVLWKMPNVSVLSKVWCSDGVLR